MSKTKRRIKVYGGQNRTIPIKDLKEVEAITNYFLRQREKAKTDVKRWQADRNWFLCLLGFNTALRAEDLLQLRVKDIEKGYISIKELKTGKNQNFRMNKYLFQDVKEFIERNELTSYDYIFTSQKNSEFAMVRQNADYILKKAAKATKLKQPFSMHSMRKTFGYQYYKNGGDLITLMNMYNHDEPYTTLMYVCWNTDDVSEARSEIYIGGSHR